MVKKKKIRTWYLIALANFAIMLTGIFYNTRAETNDILETTLLIYFLWFSWIICFLIAVIFFRLKGLRYLLFGALNLVLGIGNIYSIFYGLSGI